MRWRRPLWPVLKKQTAKAKAEGLKMALVLEKIVTSRFDNPDAPHIAGYEDSGGYEAIRRILGGVEPADVIDLVKTSGLRGRGGAGFPCGLKWSFVPQVDGPKYLAVNADEGEPGTFKDRELMLRDPHQLIEGILIASYAVGIEKAYIYIRGEFVAPWRAVEKALAEAYEKEYVGRNILGSGFSCDIYTTAERAPTSAARKPGFWNRSRASADTPASSRRFRRSSVCMRGPRSSTTWRPSRTSPTS